MPPKAPKAKPRHVPRRGAETTTPDTAPESMASVNATPPATTVDMIQTQTPIAPPVGRLDSLVGPPSGNGRGAAVPLKFKPKNVPRKTKEEREALDAKFEVTPAPVTRQRGGSSSRGPRGRGGRGGFDRQITTGASGPFALGSITTGRAQKIAVERGSDLRKYRQLSLSSTKLSKGSLGEQSSASELKFEELLAKDAEYSSSSSDSGGPRMDVEYISLLDDAKSDDEGDENEFGPGLTWGAGAPVRVPRSAHIDRTAQVNTETSSLRRGKSDLSRKGKETLFEEAVKVKDEPTEDVDLILPGIPHSPEPPRQKGSKVQSPDAKKKDTTRRSSSGRNKPVLSSLEDKEELERESLDRVNTLKELGAGPGNVKVDSEGDVGMGGDDDQPERHRNTETENQIYFFQFPSILPQLVPPTKPETRGKDETSVKAEPSSTEEAHHTPKPPTVLQHYKQHKLSTKAQQTLLESYPPPGIAGKLRIHRSGRMTILWGAPSNTGEEEGPFEMDVTRGTECEFLQEVVVMKQQSPWGDQDVDERGKRKGAAFSLGQVKGKFVVSPDFEKLLNEEKRRKGRGKGSTKRKGKEKAELGKIEV